MAPLSGQSSCCPKCGQTFFCDLRGISSEGMLKSTRRNFPDDAWPVCKRSMTAKARADNRFAEKRDLSLLLGRSPISMPAVLAKQEQWIQRKDFITRSGKIFRPQSPTKNHTVPAIFVLWQCPLRPFARSCCWSMTPSNQSDITRMRSSPSRTIGGRSSPSWKVCKSAVHLQLWLVECAVCFKPMIHWPSD